MTFEPTANQDACMPRRPGDFTPLSAMVDGPSEHHEETESTSQSVDPSFPPKAPAKHAHFVMRWLATLTVAGCAVGIVVGILCNIYEAPEDVVRLLSFPGQLFVRGLKVMVVPMIFCSMVVSTSSVGGQASNAMAKTAIRFYLSTTFIAALEGIILFNMFIFAFKPLSDQHINDVSVTTATTPPPIEKVSPVDSLIKFGFDLVPDNLASVFLHTQLLGVITFAVFFGYVVTRVPNHKVVIDFFEACNDTLVGMIRAIIYFTPIGVGSLVAGSIAKSQDAGSIMSSLGSMIGVVMIGQLFHVFGVYSALYWAFMRRSPLKHFMGLPRAWITAFGTSSSAATLSTTIKCCEDLGISKAAINFVLPIGCTVNMDGSALERPIVVLWIAYVAGQPIPFGQQLGVALTSSLLSIGGSPIPSAGVSTLYVMLESAGVALTPSVHMLAVFALAIEWFLDSIRTTVNVTGDTVGAAVVDHLVPMTTKDTADTFAYESTTEEVQLHSV